jgi:chromosome segregation ATPase
MSCELHAELVKRIDQCENDIRDLQRQDTTLTVQQAKMDTKLDNISIMLTELKIEVSKLSGQPAKRWDTLINAAIAGIVSLILSGGIAFALTKH